MRAHLHSRRYFKKMITLTISLLLVLCTCFILILYTNTYNSSIDSIYASESQRTEDLLTQSDTYWEKLRFICTVFAKLNIPFEELDVSKNYWTRNIFNSMLNSHIEANAYIGNIDVEINGNSMKPSEIAYEKHLGDFSIFTVYTEENISWPYYFDLNSTYSGKFNTVTITIDAYQLSKRLFTYEDEYRLDYLLTEEGTVLLTNQRTAFFLDINELYPDILPDKPKASETRLQSYGEYYFVLSKADIYGFRVLSMVPKQVYSRQLTFLLLQTLLMACGLLLVTILISVFLAIRFYRPVNSMVTLLRTYIPNDLHEYENEITFIHENISKYVSKGKEAETLLPQTLTQLHNAQAAVLQHQINSHFLFNTLENIKAISITELGMENEIEYSISLLNSIIREGVIQKTSIVPLSHELHLVKCYLELMQMRFPEVASHWSVDESLLQCSVFKFSLQPILENCFSHAFKGATGRPKQIHISIYSEDNTLVILIQDNGIGIDEDSLNELKLLLVSENDSDSPQHVGIRNVHKRITNVFGNDYGISIESTPPGSTVTIRYPIPPNCS